MKTTNKTLLPTLVVVGSAVSAPAAALELADISVQSQLGQPLRASIAYALGPNEQLADYCVSLQQGFAANGIPAITQANVSVANGVISLTGRAPVREPLVSLRVNISCPYTPNLSREYTMFIDPAAPVSIAATPAPVTRPQPVAARPQPVAARPQPAIAVSDVRYRVQPGDSLSQIASRIENRNVGLWTAVEQLFAANPDAFIDNDMNRLKAGSLLVIPQFSASSAPTIAPAADAVPEPVTQAVVEPVSEPLTEAVAAADPIDLENPFVVIDGPAAPNEIVDIPDTQLEAPVVASSPNVPTATVVAAQPVAAEAASSSNWLLWLVGGGIALIAGLLLFGRRRGDSFDSQPVVTVIPARDAEATVEAEAIAEPQEQIADDSPTDENLALDADLVVGTGLTEGTEVDVKQDFGFAPMKDLDLEFPNDTGDTGENVLDMTMTSANSILDEEILPEHDAVPSAVDDDTQYTGEYTMDQEIDFKILEQDYEDELTATQALNREIEQAAAELMANAGKDEIDADDETAKLTLATVTELDVTARLPAEDVTEKTEEILTDEGTVEMPSNKEAG